MDELVEILRYLKEHPEVTWSGAGLTGLGALYFLITKLFAPLFRQNPTPSSGNTFTQSGKGEQNIAQGDHPIGKQVNVTQHVTGNGNIVSGAGDVKVKREHWPKVQYPEFSHRVLPCAG